MAPSLTTRPHALPAPLVGSPRSWARDQALLFALLPLATTAPLFAHGVSYWGWRHALSLLLGEYLPIVGMWGVLAAVCGAGIGLGTPWLLERLRGRVPLPLIALLFGTLCTTVLWSATGLVVTTWAEMQWLLMPSVVGGITMGLAWVPYTMARVLGAGRRAVLAGTGALAVGLSSLAMWGPFV